MHQSCGEPAYRHCDVAQSIPGLPEILNDVEQLPGLAAHGGLMALAELVMREECVNQWHGSAYAVQSLRPGLLPTALRP